MQAPTACRLPWEGPDPWDDLDADDVDEPPPEAPPRRVINRREAINAGLRFYFTGARCMAGHQAERDTDEGVCQDCAAGRPKVDFIVVDGRKLPRRQGLNDYAGLPKFDKLRGPQSLSEFVTHNIKPEKAAPIDPAALAIIEVEPPYDDPGAVERDIGLTTDEVIETVSIWVSDWITSPRAVLNHLRGRLCGAGALRRIVDEGWSGIQVLNLVAPAPDSVTLQIRGTASR